MSAETVAAQADTARDAVVPQQAAAAARTLLHDLATERAA